MTRYTTGLKAAALALVLATALAGCFAGSGKRKPEGREAGVRDDLMRQERFRTRPPVSSRRNLYEGSLWRGAASWGNLMRDHRARYRGDLLTVTDMPKIINLPEPLPEGQQEQQQQQQQRQQQQIVDPVIAFLKEQERRRDLIDKEQTEILRSIETIEVEVVRVLPNGNLLVRGVHPPIFRSRNRVKYVVTLRGIVRPTDVDDKNQVPAPKLSKADYKIRRLVKQSAIAQQRAAAAATGVGKRKEAGLLGRLSNFLSGSRGQ